MTTHQKASFGEQLRRFREAAGLSQEELAERAGLTPGGIGALERGHRKHPYPHTVSSLAAALELSDDERAAFIAAVPRRHDVTDAAAALGATLETAPTMPTLPVPLSDFVGRCDEVSALAAMLRSYEVRLVSLTGPGGVGKTRLALEVASRMRGDYGDGVVWVDLSPIRDHRLVLAAIARSIGARESPGQSALDGLRILLQNRQSLLVLDNFEQVVEAAPELVALCERCPRLTLLVTSRMMLRVRGEREFPVRPLPVPDPDTVVNPSALEQVEAVDLFLRRARAVVPDFAVTAESAPIIAAICRRLDGLPLALELAAVRLKYLAPQTFLDWLENRLAALVEGARDLPARQQTLRATLAWSHDLLTPAEQALFRRLAVFAGGWTQEAAESVCNVEDGTVDHMRHTLSSLVDKNMVQVQSELTGIFRFAMLETVREYAQEQLAESGETALIRRRHAEHFRAFAEEAEPNLVAAGRGEWLGMVERDQDNLHAALQWSLTERNHPELGGRLAAALVWFWHLRGQASAGRAWLARALAEDVFEPFLRAKLLHGVGVLAYLQYDLGVARPSLEESAAICRRVGEKHYLGCALSALAAVTVAEGGAEEALALCRESLNLLELVGDRGWQAATLIFMGDATLRLGEPAAAQSMWERSAAISNELGDRWVQATALWLLGALASSQGKVTDASDRFRESLRLFREFGDNHGITLMLVTMAVSAWQNGSSQEAENLWTEALTLLANLGHQSLTVPTYQALATLSLAGLAAVAIERQQPERAAQLLGAATLHFQALAPGQILAYEAVFPALVRIIRDSDTLTDQARLDDPCCVTAWRAGGGMTLPDAIALARGE